MATRLWFACPQPDAHTGWRLCYSCYVNPAVAPATAKICQFDDSGP